MHNGGVASVKPAVANGLRGSGGVIVVPLHHGIAANDDLAHGSTVFGDFAAVVIDDADFGIREVFHSLTGFDDGAFT